MGNTNSTYYRQNMKVLLADRFRDHRRMITCLLMGDNTSGRDQLQMRYLANDPPIPGAPIAPFFDGPVCYSMIARQRLYNVLLYNVPGEVMQSRYRYPVPDVIILCFSMVNRESMENVHKLWVPEIRNRSSRVPIILAGVNSDLRDECVEKPNEVRYDSAGQPLEPISFEEGVQLGQQIGATAFIECRLSDGLGVNEIFYEAAHLTGKHVPLEVGVKDKTVSHRHTVALKRYNFQHDKLVSQKFFIATENGQYAAV